MSLDHSFDSGIAVRPLEGEEVSGDQAALWPIGQSALLVALVDGLGHGPLAYEASKKCLMSVESNRDKPLPAIVDACHEALAGTRGAAMAIACLDALNRTVSVVSIGNVLTLLVGGDKNRFLENPGIVGEATHSAPMVQTAEFVPGHSLLIMATDGIDQSHDLSSYRTNLFPSLQSMASMMLDRSALGNDDAGLVLVG